MIDFTVNNKSNQNVVVQFENLKSECWTVSEFGGSMSALILLYLVNQKGIDVFIKESSISLLQNHGNRINNNWKHQLNWIN